MTDITRLEGYAFAKKKDGEITIFEGPHTEGGNLVVTSEGSDTGRTLKERFADIVNVKDFGAIGDGETDDTDAIAAATDAAAGATLYFPAGTYLTSTGLRIPSDTCVRGDGMYSSIIKLTSDDFATPCITNDANIVGDEANNAGNENIFVEGLCADGNGYRDNGSGSSGHSGSAWSWKNAHHVHMVNCRGIRGRLHCLDVASAQYTELFNEDDMDWRVGASSDIVVTNFVGQDAAVDDVITTHYSSNIRLENCTVLPGEDRPFDMTYNQCGIEIDDGSENVVVFGCYAKGFCRGIVCKAHNNGEDDEAAIPAKNVRFDQCTAEGCNINFEYMYHGTAREVGNVSFLSCTSIQPVVVVEDESSPTTYLYAYGRAASCKIDGLTCIGDGETESDRGVFLSPRAGGYDLNLNARNVHFKNVVLADTTNNGLIRVTGNVANDFIVAGVTATNCGDCYVISNTSSSLGHISNVVANSETELSSSAVRVLYASAAANSGAVSGIRYSGYAHAIDWGGAYADDAECASMGALELATAYAGVAAPPSLDLKYIRYGSNLPTNGGLSLTFSRDDATGQFVDMGIYGNCAYTDAVMSMCFGLRGVGEDAPSIRWGIQANEITSGDTFCFRPYADGEYSIGRSGMSVSEVYASTASINTSDEREKQSIEDFTDDELDAWGEVELRHFLFNSAVEKKGENARIHAGVIAQQAIEAFEAHGLDATKYAFLCHDEWDDEYEDVEVEAEPAQYDENGELIKEAVMTTEKKLVTAAGDRYGIRYSEALCIEAAYQRRRADRLEEALKDLAARVTLLESLS